MPLASRQPVRLDVLRAAVETLHVDRPAVLPMPQLKVRHIVVPPVPVDVVHGLPRFEDSTESASQDDPMFKRVALARPHRPEWVGRLKTKQPVPILLDSAAAPRVVRVASNGIARPFRPDGAAGTDQGQPDGRDARPVGLGELGEMFAGEVTLGEFRTVIRHQVVDAPPLSFVGLSGRHPCPRQVLVNGRSRHSVALAERGRRATCLVFGHEPRNRFAIQFGCHTSIVRVRAGMSTTKKGRVA